MLSAISAKGELRFLTSRKRISVALFIEFLQRLIENNRAGRTLIRNARELGRPVNSRLRLLQKNSDKVHALFQMPPRATQPPSTR